MTGEGKKRSALTEFCCNNRIAQTYSSSKNNLELSAKLERISLEQPELKAEIETKLPGGPELTQLLPLTGQLAQRALYRAY